MIFVYQAYGREDIVRQTLFSVTSLFTVLGTDSPLRVWIYTDQMEMVSKFFKNHPRVHLEPITSAQIKDWRGPNEFLHRVKIKILQDAAAKTSGSLFYADGDTYFFSDPTSLFRRVSDSVSLMHIAENKIQDGRDLLSRKIRRFVKKNTFDIAGETVRIPTETVMWNAGVIGISEKNKSILPHVLELTDLSYGRYPKHVMEQMAFSYYLQNRTRIEPANAVIGHYWNQKDVYQTAIDGFLLEHPDWQSATGAYARFPWPPPPELTQKKRFLPDWLRI